VLVNALYIFQWLLKPPLVYVLIDQQTGTMLYQVLLESCLKVDLIEVCSKMATQMTRNGIRKELLLYYDGKQVAIANKAYWTNADWQKLTKCLYSGLE
jgi:hypothetical protein